MRITPLNIESCPIGVLEENAPGELSQTAMQSRGDTPILPANPSWWAQ